MAGSTLPVLTESSEVDVRPDVARLFEDYVAGLLRYLSLRAGPTSAEDLTADLFEAILAGEAQYDPDRGSERAWLYGIATNLLRRHLRSRRREQLALERLGVEVLAAAPPDAVAGRVDAQRAVALLKSTLESLRPDDRDLLFLVAWADLTPTEAAQAVGIPAGTARSRLHRARTALREALPPLSTDHEGL